MVTSSRRNQQWRIICDCQQHALEERKLWRRSVRVARRTAQRLGRRGAALLIGLPVVLGVMGLPTEAMNIPLPDITLPTLRIDFVTDLRAAATTTTNRLPLITQRVREDFLSPAHVQAFTLEIANEEFFRSEVKYGPIIYREAKRNNLPPELVAAVVEAESDFRPRLISEKNAQGLMQVLPSTGALMGAEDLFDPTENIAAGTKYLRYLFNRFGDERLALAAYNAGEGNVEKFGGVPPFPETLNYLRKVSSRRNDYRQRVRGSYLSEVRLRTAPRVD